MKQNVTGIILAGGASRRMGRDKAMLELDGATLLRSAVETVARVSDDVVIAGAGRSEKIFSGTSPVWVRDEPGAAGPLAGLAAGLAVASHPVAIVVACDMPFLSDRLLAHLAGTLSDCDAAVPVAGGRPQPLHAAYSSACLPAVRALLRLGALSMTELLSRLRVRYVPERRCLELDPEGLSWFNMNTPEDLRRAEHYAARRNGRLAAA